VNDRELLEMSAKAAGLCVWGEQIHIGRGFDGLVLSVAGSRKRPKWNPLTDDGDALRLAVRLGIDITFEAFGSVMAGKDAPALGFWCACEDIGLDVYAATRRAIVRAAAEIGRSI
jgi:hypothetical protein